MNKSHTNKKVFSFVKGGGQHNLKNHASGPCESRGPDFKKKSGSPKQLFEYYYNKGRDLEDQNIFLSQKFFQYAEHFLRLSQLGASQEGSLSQGNRDRKKKEEEPKKTETPPEENNSKKEGGPSPKKPGRRAQRSPKGTNPEEGAHTDKSSANETGGAPQAAFNS